MLKATKFIYILFAVLVCSCAIRAQDSDVQGQSDSKVRTYVVSGDTSSNPIKEFNPSKEGFPPKGGTPSPDSGTITGTGTAGTIALFTDTTEIGDSVITQSGGNINVGGAVGVQGTTPDSNVGVKLTRSGAIASSFGADLSLVTSLSGSNLYGGRFSAQSTTSGGLPDHPYTVGLSGYSSFAGSGRLDFAEGTESIVFNSGSGTMQDAYATFNQVFNSGSGLIGAGYGSYNDVVNLSTTNVMQTATAFRGRVRNFNGGGITTAYGLNLSGWSKGSGSVGTSYGIFMDNSIDLGTTRYALYSSSTSNSYLAGNLGVGVTPPGARLAVKSEGDNAVAFAITNSNDHSFVLVNQDGGSRPYIRMGDIDGIGSNTLFSLNDDPGRGAGNIDLLAPSGEINIGDWSMGHGTRFVVDDNNKAFQFYIGDVNIGTAPEPAALHVSGDFTAAGTKSAVVSISNNRKVKLYALESTENWFEDFGTSKLVKGVAHVDLDPTFVETVNTGVDYHIFITPIGNCKGLFVAEKTATGFRIKELRGGRSNAAFDYRIVARRKGYEDVRLGEVPASAQ